MIRQWSRLGFAVLCISSAAWAQRPVPAPQLPEEKAPLHSGPITFNVLVTDKAGNAISGLQQSDFSLLDDKQPAEIREFHAYDAKSGVQDPQQVILLIDDVNAPFNAVSIERTQIGNFLRSNGGHLPVPVAIVLLNDNGLEPIANASTDGNALNNILTQKQGQLHSIPRSAGFYGATEILDISLRAMEQLASFEQKQPGGKLLLWISPGWPIFDNPNVIVSANQQRSFFAAIVSLSVKLREAQMIVDQIDPLGTWDAAGPRTYLWENYTKPVPKATKADPGNLALQVLAVQSGGNALSGSNDVAGQIRKCVNEASAWYTVTFDPQRADTPDTWHNVQVKVDKPGLVVHTRGGYYAQP